MSNVVNDSLYTKNKSVLNTVLNVLIILIAALLLFEIVFTINYSGIYVVGESMNFTLNGADSNDEPGGDYVYINRRATPTYNDIVVVKKDESTTIIKRVIALGGDSIKLENGMLSIKKSGDENFQTVEENYVSPENNTGNGSQPINFPTINGVVRAEGHKVKEGCLFLMGDNRDWSLDSRERGGTDYSLSSVYGVVTNWSLNHKSFYSALHKYFYFDLPRYFGL